MSAGPTNTLEQRNNVSVGPADVTLVYKTDVTSVAATDLAAGGCNRYNPFGEATSLADWEDKRIKVTGILYQCIGKTNYQRFISKDNAKDPHAIWEALIGYYESNSVQNQSVVYQEFLALTYKSLVAVFLNELDARLSGIAAVGLKVGTPEEHADLKESLLAEAILAKLTAKFTSAKEILYQKRPLTIKMIRESLNNKRREAAAPSIASNPSIKQESALKAKTLGSLPQTKTTPDARQGGTTQPPLDTQKKKGLLCYLHGVNSFLDSGASHHMFSDCKAFTDYRECKTLIELADGNNLESEGEGYVTIATRKGATVKLKALHVPELAGTLISFGRLFERGCDVVRTGTKTFDLVNNNTVILSAEVSRRTPKRKGSEEDVSPISHWHNQISLPKATPPLEIISMDLSGKITPTSFSGNQYYFKITDHFTQYRHVYLLPSKSQTFQFFMQYYLDVTNHHKSNIETVIFDGGGEFNSKEFLTFLKSKGITVQVTAPYTPQQNPVAERANRTTSEKARCLLKQAKLTSEYWAEAVSTAVFLENVTPVRSLRWSTPYQLWFKRPFNTTRLKPFGCLAFANIPKSQRDGKFGHTSKKGPPGVSIFSPTNPSHLSNPLAPLEFDELEEPSAQAPPSPSSSLQDVLDWRSAEDELDLDALHIDVNSFFPNNSDDDDDAVQELIGAAPIPKPKPGYNIVLTSDKAPKDISSTVDKSNIFHTKRCANLARAMTALEIPR
ncbi:hypothetical protein PCANC_14583 [Puccinia coronata f. sp. avenae]|uniref:Integrase catalytic domain-containing protein n=1 Tax=Puccinia coronata f. sp. avenae TaxID=200324 RepID=A0A2N5UGB3_9BASI|nr:hypothetical protein PCANC_14583 [Puccinia coronata f. sp. avenae]